MTRKKKSKGSHRKNMTSQKLASLFKMSREELASRKMTGGGIHRSDPRFTPRSEQKRRAIEDETRF